MIPLHGSDSLPTPPQEYSLSLHDPVVDFHNIHAFLLMNRAIAVCTKAWLAGDEKLAAFIKMSEVECQPLQEDGTVGNPIVTVVVNSEYVS